MVYIMYLYYDKVEGMLWSIPFLQVQEEKGATGKLSFIIKG